MTSQWAKSCLKIPIPYHATSKKVIECEPTLLSLACSRRAWPLPVLQSEEWLNKIFSFCLMLANITIKVVRYQHVWFRMAWKRSWLCVSIFPTTENGFSKSEICVPLIKTNIYTTFLTLCAFGRSYYGTYFLLEWIKIMKIYCLL